MSNQSASIRFLVVAEHNQQRMAFSDTIREWGFELVDCIAASALTEQHLNTPVDVWLVDTEQDFDVIQTLERQLDVNTPASKKLILVGFLPAPYINESQPYAKWQRKLKRKIAHMLARPDILVTEESSEALRPWKYVVMLGASMGGPLAVKEFLDNLPENLPIAVLLAQHFNENMLHTLPRILNRHNRWRCEVITTSQPLVSGRCLILPIRQSVVCDSNGRVILQKQNWEGGYLPCISQIMLNCSSVFGTNLITIVFSGMGDDGSNVVQLVKDNGSNIWVQSPETSTCPSQPQSVIDTGQADYVATPVELAQALVKLCKTRRLPNGLALL